MLKIRIHTQAKGVNNKKGCINLRNRKPLIIRASIKDSKSTDLKPSSSFCKEGFSVFEKLKNRCRRHQRKIFQARERIISSFQKQKCWGRSKIQRRPRSSAYRNPNVHQCHCKLKGWGSAHSQTCVYGYSRGSLNE